MGDTPWWLALDPPESMPIPYSGEVIPVEVPTVPVDVPIAGPVIHYIGTAEHAVWDDVWSWVKGTAKTAASDVLNIAEQAVAEAVKISEAYTGSVLQALSGFINDAFDYTAFVAQAAIGFGVNIADVLYADIITLDADVYKILQDVVGIDNVLIPGLEAEIAKLGIDTWDLVGGAVSAVKTWAIDNIYDPVLAELLKVDTQIRTDVWDLVGAVTADIEALIHSEALTRAAAIAGIAAAVAAIATEITDCVEPMCAAQGPNTNLGKLLKGLSLALDAGLLAEIATAKESDVADAITRIARHAATVIDTFENDFVKGGATLAGVVTSELANII
jgi:hypothetical protein